jgi:3-methyladenine DNA glycosylase AlkD
MPVRPTTPGSARELRAAVRTSLAWLERKSTRRDRENLVRFGITATGAFGVSMANIQALAKHLGQDHDLAQALWATGRYAARLLSAFVEQPERVTPAQMDRWCRDFDNWGICDTVCFKLFDRVPHAWAKVGKWSGRKDEFVRRAAFALLASLALHDKRAGDKPFVDSLHLIERAAADERHFVKKAVNMALRATGKRSPALNAAAVKVARRLAASDQPAAQWVGKDALRELTSASVTSRLAARR